MIEMDFYKDSELHELCDDACKIICTMANTVRARCITQPNFMENEQRKFGKRNNGQIT